MPAADVEVSLDLVRALLRAQHPDLAALPLAPLAHGWDNELVRLGDDLIVRLPRRAIAARLIDHEVTWLPVIAPHCALPVPIPLRRGEPGEGYPYRWSIVPYLRGRAVGDSLLDDAAARTLGAFVRDLHVIAPSDAPRNPFRGIPLALRAARFDQCLAMLVGHDVTRARDVWSECVAAPAWSGAPVWLHGDLHPNNVLRDDHALCGVIDFGDICAGDPATDLAIAYMAFDANDRETFLVTIGADAATRIRARGWALAIAVAVLTNDDPELARIGERTFANVVRP